MPEDYRDRSPVIKVFGVGGGGCNAIQQMIGAGFGNVEFKCLNTDLQALAKFPAEAVVELGKDLTRGLGAGSDPSVGKTAAEESHEAITDAIGNADMLFLTAGMGGGTGTGAIPVVAKIARELGVLTVAVVTEPFAFEGNRRGGLAQVGLSELRDNADSMIVVPNENLLSFLGPDVSLVDAFDAANEIVTNAVQSITELITTSGLINVDFADVKAVMSEMGNAIMSTGSGMGEHRAEDAATNAIESPLLKNINLKEARGILANVTADRALSMGEFQIVGDVIRSIASDDANVVIGTVIDDTLNHEIKVTVVATGLDATVEKVETVKGRDRLKVVKDDKAPENQNEELVKPAAVEEQAESTADVANAIDASEENDKLDLAQSHADVSNSSQDTAASTSASAESNPQWQWNAPPANDTTAEKTDPCYVCGMVDSHKENCPLGELDADLVETAAVSHTKKTVALLALGLGVLAGLYYYVFNFTGLIS